MVYLVRYTIPNYIYIIYFNKVIKIKKKINTKSINKLENDTSNFMKVICRIYAFNALQINEKTSLCKNYNAWWKKISENISYKF